MEVITEWPKRRKLPKLMACMTKTSLENLRNKALFNLDLLDAKGIRRKQLPLYECLILELRESGFTESSDYLRDLIYDNKQLIAEDEIGIVVDLRQREDYLQHITAGLQIAEKERDSDNAKEECLALLDLAFYYKEKGKGIIWLAEKLFLASVAVSSRYLIDGGRQKNCCKYHYAKFLLDKFPGADTEEAYQLLTNVRDSSIGKNWPLYESGDENISTEDAHATVFAASSIQMHRILLDNARTIRSEDPAKAERLCRLAERRAIDANDQDRTTKAVVEIGICQLAMSSLNNAKKTLQRALKIHRASKDTGGLCDIKMHMAAVMQKLGDYETASGLLTEMGAIAMEYGLRRHLGRALHLLGELHLRRERPELGTEHLSEAFACFMGISGLKPSVVFVPEGIDENNELDVLYATESCKVYENEAEQSRLMMAISAGQEHRSSYYKLLREAGTCAVAQLKIIEWKLSNASWKIYRRHHDYLPCPCPVHQRTPLDVLRIKLEHKSMENPEPDVLEEDVTLVTSSVTDIRKLASDHQQQEN